MKMDKPHIYKRNFWVWECVKDISHRQPFEAPCHCHPDAVVGYGFSPLEAFKHFKKRIEAKLIIEKRQRWKQSSMYYITLDGETYSSSAPEYVINDRIALMESAIKELRKRGMSNNAIKEHLMISKGAW